ncbi:hypothetical protein DFS34DRAFT_336470 [Phlyctochytrium arcticum]|nr:hypothetical protein DFS34DRAFT_336470 [Phlyctochytrium arcticum]
MGRPNLVAPSADSGVHYASSRQNPPTTTDPARSPRTRKTTRTTATTAAEAEEVVGGIVLVTEAIPFGDFDTTTAAAAGKVRGLAGELMPSTTTTVVGKDITARTEKKDRRNGENATANGFATTTRDGQDKPTANRRQGSRDGIDTRDDNEVGMCDTDPDVPSMRLRRAEQPKLKIPSNGILESSDDDNRRHPSPPSVSAPHACCDDTPHIVADVVRPLLERLLSAATITSMERKYTVHKRIAEFWCTLTSPFFALPLLIYCFIPASQIPPLQHACIIGSTLAGIVSTLYHCTLYKVFSSADAAVATATFYLNAISLNRHAPASHAVWHLEGTWLVCTAGIICLFIYHWERTHHISTNLVLGCVPAAVFGFYAIESYVGLVTGVSGLLCFIVDRKGWICLHAAWHVLGGLSLLWGIWDACLLSLGPRGYGEVGLGVTNP